MSKVPFKFYAYLQIGLRRTIELTEACIREVNRGNLVAMSVLSRAALETGAVIYDTMIRVRACVDDPVANPVEDVDSHLVTAFMGGKSEDWLVSEKVKAKNIITIMDRLKKAMPESVHGWFYDGLSEHSHPNYHGMYATYVELTDEGPTSIATFTNARKSRTPLTSSLAVSGISLAMVMIEEALKYEKTNRVRFAEICEKGVYDRGTWPEGVEYPIKRSVEVP